MSTLALQNLLDYLTATLSISNRRWLAAHLVESKTKEKSQSAQESYVRDSLTKALCETKTAFAQGQKMPNAYDLLNEL